MARYFTHYWVHSTVRNYQNKVGKPLEHVAGNLFEKGGVSIGDFIYVVTVKKGRIYLIGRMKVGKLLSESQAQELLGEDFYPASDQLHAAEGSGTRIQFGRIVPLEITKRLRFIAPDGYKPLKFSAPGMLDRQTLRGVRELAPDSAFELDSLLK